MSHYYHCLPPTRLLSSRPVAPEQALEQLSAYIDAAQSDASLQPNAVLTESGPVGSVGSAISGSGGSGAAAAASGAAAATRGSAGGSLVMHNLLRVQAALRGEHLEPLPKPSKKSLTTGATLSGATANGDANGTEAANGTNKRRRAAAEAAAGDWQEPEEFDQQQVEIEGEVGDRMAGVTQGADAAENLAGVEHSIDKEARKKAKKERSKKDKKVREKARKQTAAE